MYISKYFITKVCTFLKTVHTKRFKFHVKIRTSLKNPYFKINTEVIEDFGVAVLRILFDKWSL